MFVEYNKCDFTYMHDSFATSINILLKLAETTKLLFCKRYVKYIAYNKNALIWYTYVWERFKEYTMYKILGFLTMWHTVIIKIFISILRDFL